MLGCSGKDAENSTQSRRFLPPFHRYLDFMGSITSALRSKHLAGHGHSKQSFPGLFYALLLEVAWLACRNAIYND